VTVDYANFIDAANNKKHDSCVVCHDGTTNAPSAAAGNCSKCHTANYFASHGHVHDVSYDASVDTSQPTEQGCAACHDDSGNDLVAFSDIVTEHINCAKCHSYTDDGKSTPVQTTVESVIATGTSVTCATCHVPKVPNFEHGIDHVGSGFVTIEGACEVCHVDPATTFIDSNDAKVHNGCTTCHDATTNELISLAAGHEGGLNVCTTCHENRVWADHDIDHETAGYVTLHSECTSCHADTMTAGQGFISAANDEKHNACSSCHAADGTPSTVSGDCSLCHSGVTGNWASHTQDHTSKVTSAPGCDSCHSATVAYASFVDSGNGLKHDTCYVCHNAATKLASAAAGDCSQCHSGVTGNFATHATKDHTDKVTQDAACNACHSATVDYLNFVDTANALKHDNCAVCHNVTTNAPIAATGTCIQCHSGIVLNFATHATKDHTGKVNQNTACAACHSATVDYLNFVDTANALKHDNCAVCHIAGTNAPIQTAGDCSQCHSSVTGNFATHITKDHTSKVTQDTACAACHGATVDYLNFVNATNALKHDNCAVCHDGTTNAPIAAAGTCNQCHSGIVTSFATHATQDHTSKVTLQSECTGCHDLTVAAPYIDGVDDKKHDSCAVCHNATTNAPLALAGDCSKCHTANYFNSHTHHTTGNNGVTYNAVVDISQGSNPASCGTTNCHNQFNLDTWSGILSEHETGCGRCHNYTDDGSGTPPQNANDTAISSGNPATCTTCHTPKLSPAGSSVHGGHAPADFGWTTSCSASACHNEAGDSDIIASPDVHNSNCGLCHVSSGGGGTLRSYAVGKTISEATTCATCHGTGPIEDLHHPNAHAQAGDCTWCHADPRPGWVTAYSVTAPNPLPLQLACVKCHVAPSGTGLVVYRNTYAPVNVSTSYPNGNTSWGVNGDASVQQTAVHTITGAAKINVYNYGACLGCHDGNTTGAAQIQVWHAKPTWNKDTHDTQNSQADDLFDVLRNSPGRTYYANNHVPPTNGTVGTADDVRFNIFATTTGTGGVAQMRMYGRYNWGDSQKPYRNSNNASEDRGKPLYGDYASNSNNPWVSNIASAPGMNRVTIPQIDAVNDPGNWMTSNPQIPYFDDIAPPVLGESITVSRADWEDVAGGTLTVHALNTGSQSNQAYVDGNTMTWQNSQWEYVATGVAYQPTVRVTTASPGDGDITTNVINLSGGAAAVSLLAPLSGTTVVDGTSDSGNFSYEIGAGSNRLLIVSIYAVETGTNSRSGNLSASYGGTSLTTIVDGNASGQNDLWVGYLDEADIAARGNNTLSFNNGNTSWDRTKVHVMAFEGVKQSGTGPIADSDISITSYAVSSRTTKSFSWDQGDMPIYSAGSREDSATHSTPSGFTQEFFTATSGTNIGSMSSGYTTDVSSAGSGTISVTFSQSDDAGIAGIILRAAANP
jgi:hypothetical protein